MARSTVDGDVRAFSLTARAGSAQLLPGTTTPTWGFDGDYLGPTLRARIGEQVRVEVTNDLDEPTSVHWHGMHLPAAMDGGPHQPIDPGSTWTPTWTVRQEPATLWYHPHVHGQTEEHVYRGLAGLFILDPGEGPDQRLPHSYGIDDVPVVIQDKKLADDGDLVFDDSGNEIGLLGNVVLANGTFGAHHLVETTLVRLRVLNGSTARSYLLGFDDGREFYLIGTDGGLLAAPDRRGRVPLSPGERVEIVVEVRPRERVRLRSYGAELGGVVAGSAFGADDEVDVLELRAGRTLGPSPAVPQSLADLEVLHEDNATVERSFVLEGRRINGERMDMDRIDEVVELGATEVWEVRSKNLFPHNFHVHDVQLQVLSIDGQPPPSELAGWKDTVYLAPLTTYRFIMRFQDYADAGAPYMFHCHLLLHEDEGMMGQFVVVHPGEEPGPIDGHHH